MSRLTGSLIIFMVYLMCLHFGKVRDDKPWDCWIPLMLSNISVLPMAFGLSRLSGYILLFLVATNGALFEVLRTQAAEAALLAALVAWMARVTRAVTAQSCNSTWSVKISDRFVSPCPHIFLEHL